jgi:hypothetical protein
MPREFPFFFFFLFFCFLVRLLWYTTCCFYFAYSQLYLFRSNYIILSNFIHSLLPANQQLNLSMSIKYFLSLHLSEISKSARTAVLIFKPAKESGIENGHFIQISLPASCRFSCANLYFTSSPVIEC